MESDLITRRTLTLVGVIVVGIVGSGLARRLLGLAGYSTAGRLVFVLGYATMVVVVWYGWIRPLDLTGPTEG
jgi:hypothetical protein